MRGKWTFLILLVCLGAFGYLFLLNPTQVSFRLFRGTPLKTNLALIVFLSFLSGFGAAFLTGLGQEVVLSLRLWYGHRREARREKGRQLFSEGRSFLASEKPKAAGRLLRRAYRRLPDDLAVVFDLARAEAAQGKDAAAETRLKALLEDAPHNVEALALLLHLQQRRGDTEGQRTTLATWLEADPSHLPSLRALRDLYRCEGKWPETIRVQEKVIARSEGRDARANERRLLSELLVEGADQLSPLEAHAQLKRASAEDPEYAPAHFALGNALVQQGDTEGAFRAWLRGYEATGQVGLLLRMEELRLQQNRSDEMLKLYRKIEGKTNIAALLRARLLVFLDRSEEALDLLEKLKPSTTSQWLLGEAFLRLRSFERAAKALRESAGDSGKVPSLLFSCSACKSTAKKWGPACPQCGTKNTLGVYLEHLPPSALAES